MAIMVGLDFLLLSITTINFVGILFPYGENYGDQLQTSSANQKKLLFSCKYFGVQEDSLYVSYILSNCIHLSSLVCWNIKTAST